MSEEQKRIDMIVRSFSKLPESELSRLGVDLSQKIYVGSDEANKLLASWRERQEEIKLAMAAMTKPAEMMGELAKGIKEFIPNESDNNYLQIEEKLVELEGLLEDMDNARDFYTIGAWPTLVSMLHSSKPDNIRALAAWCVGTAVKNNYDYQLFTLDKDGATIRELVVLLEQGSIEAKRKALYAISAASRGNTDVQSALMREDIKFLAILKTILIEGIQGDREVNASTLELDRKIWSFVGDMLEEKAYVEGEFLHSIPEDRIEEAMDQLNGMQFIGSAFNNDDWLSLLSSAFEKTLTFFAKMPSDIQGDQETLKKTENIVRALLLNLLQCSEKMASMRTTGMQERGRLIGVLKKIVRVETEKVGESKDVHTDNNDADEKYDDADDIDEKALIENDVREQASHVLKILLEMES